MDNNRTVALSNENAAFIEEVVAAGEFGSGEAVVAEALREWRERRDNHGYTIAELRRLVEEGERSGPGRDGAEIIARLRDKYMRQVAG